MALNNLAVTTLVRALDLHPVRARQLAEALRGGDVVKLADALEAKANGPPVREGAINVVPPRPSLASVKKLYSYGKGRDITAAWIRAQAIYRIGEWDRLYAPTTSAISRKLTKQAMEAMAFDWSADVEDAEQVFHKRFKQDSAEEVFRSAIRPWPEEGWRGVEVGNTKFGDMPTRSEEKQMGRLRKSNTPTDFYRLLYLCEPVGLDFDDMYGCGLFGITSPCRRFAMNFYLHSYELAAYQKVNADLAVRTREERGAFRVECGVPGADNGVATKDKDALAWFEMVSSALQRRWGVYPGNDFEV